MGIFADYVNTYDDLKKSWNNITAKGGDYDLYVGTNADLEKAYSDATGNKAWGQYVDRYSDLKNAWDSLSSKDKASWGTKGAWGQNHYNSNGQKEGRIVPFFYGSTAPGSKAVTSKAEWGQVHYSLYGANEGRAVPYNDGSGTPLYSADDWGAKHWQEAGNTEDRILPGAKLNVDSAGNVYIANTDLIGSGALSSYQNLVKAVNNAPEGTYKSLMEGLKDRLDSTKFTDLTNNYGIDVISSGYQKSKVKAWDGVSLGAQPPTGGFNVDYYKLNTEGGKTATDQWNKAQTSVSVGGQSLPDLDITGRYTKDSYLHWYYTTQGKAAGDRGNAAETASIPEEYTEFLTDADYQLYRDNVLGLADRFDNIKDWAEAQDPDVLAKWYKSLPSDQKAQYDEGTLAVPTLDYIPDSLRSQVKMTKGTTILEGELAGVLGEKEKEKQQMFSALSQDSLRQAAAELQKAKLQEQQFDFYKGLPGLNEVMTINESLANSLLGDTGIGGIFGWMGDTNKTQESLEKSLGTATGIPSRSSAVYNWQKWFDDQLVERYEGGLQIQDPLDPSVTYDIDAEFAKDYIDRYLKPRFDTSRSMSEFVSYMDVKQNEQNIFQTQSALDSLRDIADLRSKAYLDQVKSTSPLNFSADFYWDPQGNFSEDDPKYQTYLKQKDEVAADWETAKFQGDTAKVPGTDWTWNQWAYYYGLNPNDKNQFAKLHYQVKGAAAGFDPAKDVITLKDAEDYIQTKILPEIADEKLNIGDITFLNFVTPEEYADKLLEGISPESHKEEWDKLLETLGLSEKDMGIAEVKQYIIDAFRTGAAKEIRESIKYLNEKKLTPTQERLGAEYIERPEDAKPTDDPNATALYKVFQNAGYQGSEDEFYKDFMPDVDRSEMELVTQAGKGKGLQASSLFSGLSSSDPFEALASMQSIFDTSEKSTTTTKEKEAAPSYFKLFEDETKDTDYKSKTGQKILGEFTSLFKGFN